jgi:hypothetical protein
MDEREIEAAARIVRDELPYAVKHSTATRLAGLILARVRDVRGDEWACPKCGKPSASPPAEVYCVDCATEGWEQDAAAHRAARSPQDEDHEAGIEAALAAWPRHSFIVDGVEPDKVNPSQRARREALLRSLLAAYLSRVSLSRVGSVAVEDVERLRDIAVQAMMDALSWMDPDTGKRFLQEPSYRRFLTEAARSDEAGRLHAGTGSDRIFMHSTHQRPMAGCRLCEAETARSPQDEDHEAGDSKPCEAWPASEMPGHCTRHSEYHDTCAWCRTAAKNRREAVRSPQDEDHEGER